MDFYHVFLLYNITIQKEGGASLADTSEFKKIITDETLMEKKNPRNNRYFRFNTI